MNEWILLVDDDPEILSAFQRNLRKTFKIKTASDGFEAIDMIKESPTFAVVVSDFKMPKIDGIELLSVVKKISPDTVRVLLTGYADLDTSMNAVNEGNIFRFLTKPVNTATLISTINDSLEQHRLQTLEKELLEKTLKGSIKILTDIISAVNPLAFNKGANIRNLSRMIADRLNVKNMWEIEIAALLSQIGCVIVPPEILEKKEKNRDLNPTEEKIYRSHPEFGGNLLRNIPRFEVIADGIASQFQNFNYRDEKGLWKKSNEIPLIGRILRVAIDYDELLRKGFSRVDAIKVMAEHSQLYDPEIFKTLCNEFNQDYEGYRISHINFKKLRIGMILADDIVDDKNFVMLSKGNEITDVLLMRLVNLSKYRQIREPIKIYEI